MAFLNTLGRVSRHGRWHFRHAFRVADAAGRVDLSDNGLVALGHASDVMLTLHRRAPHHPRCEPHAPVLSASVSAGTLRVLDPGFVEAVFPDGWSHCVPPAVYDLRIAVVIDGDTAVILDQPIEIA